MLEQSSREFTSGDTGTRTQNETIQVNATCTTLSFRAWNSGEPLSREPTPVTRLQLSIDHAATVRNVARSGRQFWPTGVKLIDDWV